MYQQGEKMNFKTWLEFQKKDFNYYKNLILAKMGLDSPEGLSVPIDSYEPENFKSELEALGEFKELKSDVQEKIKKNIDAGEGTIEDIIRIMSDEKDII